MQRKLGIIAGGGPLPKYLAEHCQYNGREYFVIALVGNADERILHALPVKWVRLGAAGKIIQSLKYNIFTLQIIQLKKNKKKYNTGFISRIYNNVIAF